jgi:hypothetical protein
VPAFRGTLISSKSKVYLPKDGEAVRGILEMVSCDWSNVIRHHTLDTRSDTEFDSRNEVLIWWKPIRVITARPYGE